MMGCIPFECLERGRFLCRGPPSTILRLLVNYCSCHCFSRFIIICVTCIKSEIFSNTRIVHDFNEIVLVLPRLIKSPYKMQW